MADSVDLDSSPGWGGVVGAGQAGEAARADHDHEAREQAALRTVAVAFLVLAASVTIDAGRALAGVSEPEHSTIGIALAAVSLAVMPLLSFLERRPPRRRIGMPGLSGGRRGIQRRSESAGLGESANSHPGP